uniref:RUN and SH3 domain containing 2 n=1 Tax=Tetraodon nigroviridis TaxID=99883 RepID=H3DD33_TETNG
SPALFWTMASPRKLSGETLIVHHIPLVHCQVSGGRRAQPRASLKRSNPFSLPENLGLSRTTSLPERDVLQREALLYSSLIQTSGGVWAPFSTHKEKKSGSGRGGSTTIRHNPFLLNHDDDDDGNEEEDADGDNLSGYLEDSSFHLHSDTNSALDEGVSSFHLHDLRFTPEPFLLHNLAGGSSQESLRGLSSDLSNHFEDLEDIVEMDVQRRHGSSGSNMSMDCAEHDWGDYEEDEDHSMRCGRSSKMDSYSSSSSTQHCSCCALSQSYQCQQDYASDSSCNSSDGVLVNFSAIYSKMNNGVPEKTPLSGHANLNHSTDHSCTSSTSDLPGNQQHSTKGAFYLDLHTSPTDPPTLQRHPTFPVINEPRLSSSSTCSCAAEHQGALDLDANCNSYHPLHSESSGDLASCLQSQARLVVATQNYYKLVTCDLSSQSSPSPAGSSVNSCSDEHSKSSPTPTQPTEYFLFKQPADEEDEESGSRPSIRVAAGTEAAPAVMRGQVYVNVSPPTVGRCAVGEGSSSGCRPRSRSYDRNLGKTPSPRLGSLERMLSCPVRLSEGAAQAPPPPPRVTSFAEIARSKRRNGGVLPSPSLKAAADPFSSTFSTQSHSSADFSPILEHHVEVEGHSLPAVGLQRQTDVETHTPLSSEWLEFQWIRTRDSKNCLHWSGQSQRAPAASLTSPNPAENPRTHMPFNNERGKAGGGKGTLLVRYRKDQRPTTLPIQPFTFHHQFATKPPQPKPPVPLSTGQASGMQAQSSPGSSLDTRAPTEEDNEDATENMHRSAPPPGSVRPSPLGSYSPVQLQGGTGSSTCSTCTSSPQPPHTLSCQLQSPGTADTPPPPSLGVKRGMVPPVLPAVRGHCLHHGTLSALSAGDSDVLSPLGCLDPGTHTGSSGQGGRSHHAHHLSPQALKWREYRRRNPSGPGGHGSNLEHRSGGLPRQPRRNVFDFPPAPLGQGLGHFNGAYQQSVGTDVLQQSLRDFQPDYFSLSEKPPEEFCLSPNVSTSASSGCSPKSHISVDLTQKRGLVKAVNTAVDLIVAHFGTSRDPDVKAKLGNSWVSPNVGHLILKYLCPALHEVLQDGLKPYVLDLIIGQRRCQPWSLAEASTQLGPSTRVLHSLFSKVSQYSELTNHSLRLNSFIFGLLNLKSLEFWFSHLYTHDDIIAAHYNPWGFLPLSQGVCQPLFEELLLLLQPLSLLPFDLDLLFEPHLLQNCQEQLRRKEQLCSAGQSADRSARSTFQLIEALVEVGISNLWRERGMTGQRMKGVGQERLEGGKDGQKTEADEARGGRQRQERNAGWWYQLMQSSQVYIDQSTEGAKFVRNEKRKKSLERRQAQLPPTREGVVEGAESVRKEEGYRSSRSSTEPAGSRARLSWMGSPPESIIHQEKEAKPLKVSGMEDHARAPEQSPSKGQSLRWGRLFGAVGGSHSRVDGAEDKTKCPSARPPSGWLSLDRSVLDFVAQTIGVGKKTESPDTPTCTQTTHPTAPTPAAEAKRREVQALCHHIATEPGQLSFSKGDVMEVVSRVHPDWLLCSLGSAKGLVPIVYVTLNSTEESQDSAGHG